MAGNRVSPGYRSWFGALALNLIGLTWSLPAWASGPEAPVGELLIVSVTAPAYWCPYACDADQAHWGFAVEIARTALEASGHMIVYRNLPYDRALVETARGDIDAIVPAFRDETPGFIYPRHAVSESKYCFYVSGDNPWRYAGTESLDSIRFAATSGYSYSEAIDAYIAENLDQGVLLVKGDDIPRRLQDLVRIGRFDALLDDRLLLESSENRVDLVNAGCLADRPAGYLALSPQHPDRSEAIARAFDRGLTKIRADGRLCTILDKYGIDTDYVPGVEPADCRSDSP